MKHIDSSKPNWIDKEGYSKKIFLTEQELCAKGILVQQIKIKPGEIAKSHHHQKQTEISTS